MGAGYYVDPSTGNEYLNGYALEKISASTWNNEAMQNDIQTDEVQDNIAKNTQSTKRPISGNSSTSWKNEESALKSQKEDI
ncbi:hypothetical protein AgCh_032576 [Apium graveolens]